VAQAGRLLGVVPVVHEVPGPAPQELEPAQGAHPELALAVGVQGADAEDAVGIGELVALAHGAGPGIEALQPGVGAQPEGVVLRVRDHPDVVVGQAGGVAGLMTVGDEGAPRGIEQAQAHAIGAHPHPPAAVLVQREDRRTPGHR
jgi:hypothetical protein